LLAHLRQQSVNQFALVCRLLQFLLAIFSHIFHAYKIAIIDALASHWIMPLAFRNASANPVDPAKVANGPQIATYLPHGGG